jgi:O-antigen biosynthesis protein WbqP
LLYKFERSGAVLYLFIKRLADIILSFIGLIVLAPVFLIISLAIRIDSKGPVFFKQKRVGKGKKYFNMIKFRTMKIETPKNIPTH